MDKLESRPPLETDQELLWQSMQEDVAKGWAIGPLTRADLDAHFGRVAWCPQPTSVHLQPSVKRRRIDNSRKSGANSTLEFSETMFATSSDSSAIALRIAARTFLQVRLVIDDRRLRRMS